MGIGKSSGADSRVLSSDTRYIDSGKTGARIWELYGRTTAGESGRPHLFSTKARLSTRLRVSSDESAGAAIACYNAQPFRPLMISLRWKNPSERSHSALSVYMMEPRIPGSRVSYHMRALSQDATRRYTINRCNHNRYASFASWPLEADSAQFSKHLFTFTFICEQLHGAFDVGYGLSISSTCVDGLCGGPYGLPS